MLPSWRFCDDAEQQAIEERMTSASVSTVMGMHETPLYSFYLIKHLEVLNLITDNDGRKVVKSLMYFSCTITILIECFNGQYLVIDFKDDDKNIVKPFQIGYIFWQVARIIAEIYKHKSGRDKFKLDNFEVPFTKLVFFEAAVCSGYKSRDSVIRIVVWWNRFIDMHL